MFLCLKNSQSNFEIISVGITECEKSERCEFKRGKEYSLQIGFKPDKKVDSLKTLAHLGDARGALTRFHVDNEDACIESNITCPLMPNKIYWYKQTVLLLQEYPIVDLQVNWLLINPDAEKNDKGLPTNRDIVGLSHGVEIVDHLTIFRCFHRLCRAERKMMVQRMDGKFVTGEMLESVEGHSQHEERVLSPSERFLLGMEPEPNPQRNA
uniref:MD-2-related lipid-recognition domain-containing protein n=1 Tax=Meloidogyne javanica TaxID=6303 RepID=A0A915M8C7_MELJA